MDLHQKKKTDQHSSPAFNQLLMFLFFFCILVGKKNTLAVIPAVFSRENSTEKKERLRFPVGFMEQFFILYKRKIKIQRRDTVSTLCQKQDFHNDFEIFELKLN